MKLTRREKTILIDALHDLATRQAAGQADCDAVLAWACGRGPMPSAAILGKVAEAICPTLSEADTRELLEALEAMSAEWAAATSAVLDELLDKLDAGQRQESPAKRC
jgi:hypothetical protein